MHSTRLARPRVNERLQKATRFPVTLIVAPAGFGKTIALRDFLETTGLTAVRYDVRREDGTLLAFVRRLSEALEPIAPSALASFPEMQQRVLAAEEPVRQLSDWFFEHLQHIECTIVLDDLHYAATDPASIALLADVIERTTQRIKWIIAARSDVGLPVATWIAYGRMDIPIGEEELRFTTDEAMSAADQTQREINPQEIEALRQLTEGWPVALSIALRTRTHSVDLRTASSGTREMVYRYLAEQIFTGLSLEERAFAMATSVFSSFDSGIIEALGASAQFFAALRRRIAFLNEPSPGEYRYHDLFRDFLETELRRAGERDWTRAMCNAAGLLERRGDDAAALVLYTRARSFDDILRVLDKNGFSLFEQGETTAVSSALEILPTELRQSSATALGLHATLEAARGRFEVAEPDFKAAIAVAGHTDLTVTLVSRYAIELVRQNRDSTSLLEPYAFNEEMSPRARAPLLGTLATAYAQSQRIDDAVSTVQKALEILPLSVSDTTRARLYQQAAYVYHFLADTKRTETYASLAIELALARGLYEIAARGFSVLYTIRYEADNIAGCVEALEHLGECARKSASIQARLFGLMAAYEIEVERGNDDAIARIYRELQEAHSTFTPARAQALMPALAIQSAWSGRFQEAYELRASTAQSDSNYERRALRAAETSLYAFASGLHEAGQSALHDAFVSLKQFSRTTLRALLARVFLALAELLRGHHASAHRLLTEVEQRVSSGTPRLQAFVNAVRVQYRMSLGQATTDEWQAAMERLRANHYAGIARLLAALPTSQAEPAGYATLTPSERDILELLAAGASTKDIAIRTKRSPHTVDTHIRAICRKLSCSGRREAVALAVGNGWVHR